MDQNIILLLKQLNLSLEQYGRNQMKNLDISPSQSLVLEYLFFRNGDIVYATELHEKLGISKSAISSTLKGLKKKGYVETATNPEDDRMKQIFLTPKAFAMKERIESGLQEEQRHLCREIPSQHLEIMKKGLNTMIHNLRQESARRKEQW